jgi:hypothetical protein
MTVKSLYPTVLPSLNLDFANSKKLDPRVTFTRASVGTFVNENGLVTTAASGAARFDHDPVTGKCLGLLVEEARTNLALRSEEFDNAYWFKRNGATVTANAVAAPDGTTTGDELIHPGGTTYARIETNPGVPVTSGSKYTLSVFAKYKPSSEATVLAIQFQLASGVAYVNLNTKTIISGDGVSIQLLSNEWVRISRTFTASSTATGQIYLYPTNTTNIVPSPSIAANSGLYIWGAQMEAGAFPTSYIPTVASTVTRAADVASITGSNFSSWYNQSAGSWFVNHNGGNPFAITVGTDANNRYYLSENSAAGSGYFMKTLGVNQFSFSTGIFTKGAISYGANYANIATSGTLQTAATSVSPPVSNSLKIGMGINNDFQGTGTISHLTYYPVRLPDAQLQALTAT